MTIIEKIINWFKNLFRRLFGKKKKQTKTVRRVEIKKDNPNVKRQMSIDQVFDGTLPPYLIITTVEKDKLLYSISIMKSVLEEKYDKLIEKEEIELINFIKTNVKVNKEVLEEEKDTRLTIKLLNLLIKDFSNEEKKEVIDKYQVIQKHKEEHKARIVELDKTVKVIENSDISFVAENEIEREVSNITNDKNEDKIEEKIDNFNKKTSIILKNIDEDFIAEVLKNYSKVNFITVSTTIIDKDYEILRKLEEDFKKHRFNKRYYEREINKIKRELKKIKNLRNNKEIYDHIVSLRGELYTKSKDKYDLLYNDEIITNFEKECDDLLDNVNAKVIDIKKDKEEKKEEKKDSYIKNILLRFKDMELARLIILSLKKEDYKLLTKDDILNRINEIYTRFNRGLNNKFNFDRNKTKTELVILYNDINSLISKIEKKPFISIDHINFKMDDLLEASRVKKEELSGLLKRKSIADYDYKAFDEKMEALAIENYPSKVEKPKVLKKVMIDPLKKDDK